MDQPPVIADVYREIRQYQQEHGRRPDVIRLGVQEMRAIDVYASEIGERWLHTSDYFPPEHRLWGVRVDPVDEASHVSVACEWSSYAPEPV